MSWFIKSLAQLKATTATKTVTSTPALTEHHSITVTYIGPTRFGVFNKRSESDPPLRPFEKAARDCTIGNDEERVAVRQRYDAGRAMISKWENNLRAGVPTAHIVELPGANLYMFLSNEADVLREIRAFAATLTARATAPFFNCSTPGECAEESVA